MILPIGDAPNPRGYRAWITWLIIALNIGIYLLISLPLSGMRPAPDDPLLGAYLRVLTERLPAGVSPQQVLASLSQYDLFIFAHGYKPGAPSWADLFSSLFLHAGLAHLAGNMLFLWIYGDNVEHRLGRLGFLLAYLGTGVAATLGFSLLAGASMTPLVGASGAISGVLGFYFLLFPRNKIKLLVVLVPFFFDTIFVSARIVLGLYVVADNLLPLLLGARSGVAYGAHLGGFLGGLALAGIGSALHWRWPWGDTWRPSGDGDPSDAVALQQALLRGDERAALSHLARLSASDLDQLDPDTCVQLAEHLDAAGHPLAANRMLRRCLGADASPAALARARLTLGRMRLREGRPAEAYAHLHRVLQLSPRSAEAEAARALLAGLEPRRWRQPP